MKKLFIFFLCTICIFNLSAQNETTSLMQKSKELGEKTKKKINFIGHLLNDMDTTYVEPNKYNFAFMLENSNWYEYYCLTTNEDKPQQLSIAPNMSYKIGAYFGWKWIFLGWCIDIRDILGNRKPSEKKTEFGLSLYSSVVGGDIYYRKSGSDFKIRSTSGIFNPGEEPSYDKNIDAFSVNIKGLNVYWVFNHKKFSYPAAFSQSSNQRRSAGSFLGGFSYSQHEIHFDHSKLPNVIEENLNQSLKFKEINYSDYSLSFGYAYNWVFARNCLASISLMPAVAYKNSRIDLQEMSYPTLKNFNLDLITRAGIVYNNSKYFVGTSLVMHTYDYRTSNFDLNNSFGTIRVYAGFNFSKKKKYNR